MKHTASAIILFLIVQTGLAQVYWQQQANFTIDVSLNDKDRSLDGFLKLEYTNNSPDSLPFIWFHLWPNAFRNDRTAFSEQLLQHGRTDFYFSEKEEKGYINRLDFRTSNQSLATEDHPLYIDVIKVILPKPLPPSGRIEITTPFHVKLSKNFSRGGYLGESFQVTQWFPKPAVYDHKGWHPMPYLDQGEFYSEFGNYDVRITVQKDFVVAATGELQDLNEINWMKERVIPAPKQEVKATVKKGTTKSKSKTPEKKKELPEPSRETKTLQFLQENVHDFAWFADKNFIVQHDSIALPSGRFVNVCSFNKGGKEWSSSIEHLKDAIRFRSELIGEYPYNVVSAVETGNAAGMEYPTITSIATANEGSTEGVIEHEVGHNWFYGILASNEREYPWMDEGMNSYYDSRYNQWKGIVHEKNQWSSRVPSNLDTIFIEALAKRKMDQPINTPSEKFTEINYGVIGYQKAAIWMKSLERELGQPVFDSAMREYFRRFKFRHPYPEDFRSVIESVSGKNLSEYFAKLDQKGGFNASKRKLRPALFFSLHDADRYSYINFLPAIGYNKYDGFMIGAIIHNYNLVPDKLQFHLMPLFATSSKTVNGFAGAEYSIYPDTKIRKVRIGLSGARFSIMKGIDSNGVNVFGNFSKVVPYIKIHFNNDPRSSVDKWIEWKTFFIREQGFNYFEKTTDSLFYPDEAPAKSRYLNQLSFNIVDYRVLYPYELQLQLQQGDGFYRANLNGNYFFNYPDGGGMNARLFAAKFGYIGGKTAAKEFETISFQPKLTAVRGNEDYTYSNAFIGRNETDGFAGQQIMVRDGGLKLRTDLFSDLQGRSDNWTASINLNTTLPLKMFPVKIPLRLFLDIGTYAGSWKKDAATSRFLYVGGLQLSLFKDLVNIYAPIFYSSEFRDNLKTVPEENTFWKRLSFSIDVHRFNLRKITGNKVAF